MVDITGLDKAAVLAALCNNSKPLGLGVWQYEPGNMSIEEARAYLADKQGYEGAEYLKGRAMKVDLSGNSFDEWLYDRDNGPGAAARAVDGVRKATQGKG